MSRRRFFRVATRLAVGVGAAGGVSYLLARGFLFRPEERAPSRFGYRGPLDDFVNNITSGGPPKDGIPSIDQPRFVSATAADFLSDTDVVFGLIRDGEIRAYPQLVLVRQEEWAVLVELSVPAPSLPWLIPCCLEGGPHP